MGTRCLCDKSPGALRCARCPLPRRVYRVADRLNGKVTMPPRQLDLKLEEKPS